MRNLLDVHAAFSRHHEGYTRGLAIDQHRDVEFLFDFGAVLDVQPVDLLACRPGLFGDQRASEHFLGEACNFIDRLRQPHAALGVRRQALELALAAPTGMDL